MIKEESAVLCRIFIGEETKISGRPLFEKIVDMAREHGISGVTVLKGILGYGCRKHIHTAKVLHLAEDLPLIIEIVESRDKLNEFLPIIEPLKEEGMITKETIMVTIIRKNKSC